MSNIYHTEPPTHGKVLVKTSSGDIDIELWPREAPLACRNFVQLCLESYYDGCLIHRVIKDFMIQMGDPNGDGTGGTSIWGRPFKDEIHGRIKFNHRGQVAMANENKPHTNLSQFFITLAPCDWIDRKHTIFGKVTGNTIYNVMRIGDVEIDGKDKPVDPIKILTIEVLLNPFDDIVPRDVSRKAAVGEQSNLKQKPARKATNDLKLLSFGDEEAEGEFITQSGKMHSIHDSKFKGSRLSDKIAEEVHDVLIKPDKSSDDRKERRSSHSSNTKSNSGTTSSSKASRGDSSGNDDTDSNAEDDFVEGDASVTKSRDSNASKSSVQDRLDRMKKRLEDEGAMMADLVTASKDSGKRNEIAEKSKEFARLREDLLRSKRAVKVITGADAEQIRKDTAFKDLTTPLEQRRQKYMKRKNEHGSRQDETMAKLQQFTSSLKKTKIEAVKVPNAEKSSSKEAYHGQILEHGSDEEEGEGGADREEDTLDAWHVGPLKFRKHIDDQYRLGAGTGGDGRRVDEYDVVDSRDVGLKAFARGSKPSSSSSARAR